MLSFGAVVSQVAETAEPHQLCAYLFEVASLFTAFFSSARSLQGGRRGDQAVPPGPVRGRADGVLTTGLGLLGVPLPDRM